MKRALSMCALLLCALLGPLPAGGAAPARAVSEHVLRVCERGGVSYRVDGQGRVRSATFGLRALDGRQHQVQSYDRQGRLTGVTVRLTGFAGRVLDVRGTFDARGRLVSERGYRAAHFDTPLGALLRPVPDRVACA